jgi:hypothetical protein
MTTDTRTPDATDNAELQAKAQLESIREMLAAVAVDYDRLEELRDARDNSADDGLTVEQWAEGSPDDAAELAELEAAAGDCTDEDDARQRIQEDPLSVQIRSGWYSPGETPEPEEFEILLCTGGPAVRILGELGTYNGPSRARLQYQDWGTPWTEYFEPGINDTLVEYALHFYFGDE